jgi:hypothetical protein
MGLRYLKPSAKHGTRGCYVTGCRCDDCRKANTSYYHSRQAKIREALKTVRVAASKEKAQQLWTRPDGTKAVRFYSRLCPGIDEEGCPKKRHLRKDSAGGLCADCRSDLVWNGLVPADRARLHLFLLGKSRVGRRAVHKKSGVAQTLLKEVRTGRKTRIRKNTEARILAVSEQDTLPGTPVSARWVWSVISQMQSSFGFSKAALAKKMGYVNLSLQFSRKLVLPRTIAEVKKLWDEIQENGKLCLKCGCGHWPSYRQRVLKRMLPCTIKEVLSEYSCLFELKEYSKPNVLESRTLYRDLHALGAVPVRGVWALPEKAKGEQLSA